MRDVSLGGVYHVKQGNIGMNKPLSASLDFNASAIFPGQKHKIPMGQSPGKETKNAGSQAHSQMCAQHCILVLK